MILFGSRSGELRQPRNNGVVLSGLSICLATGGKAYQVVSEVPPEPDRPGDAGGVLWPCSLLSLPDGGSIEQEMMLPVDGNAAAISWRRRDRSRALVQLRVSPIFTAPHLSDSSSFEVEPEIDGGRLAWRPFRTSSKIFADTNGRLVRPNGQPEDGFAPGSFEFALGPGPALLIFSSETRQGTNVNPLLGGFLARLTPQGAGGANSDSLSQLIAA